MRQNTWPQYHLQKQLEVATTVLLPGRQALGGETRVPTESGQSENKSRLTKRCTTCLFLRWEAMLLSVECSPETLALTSSDGAKQWVASLPWSMLVFELLKGRQEQGMEREQKGQVSPALHNNYFFLKRCQVAPECCVTALEKPLGRILSHYIPFHGTWEYLTQICLL